MTTDDERATAQLILRISDIANEPRTNLIPIRGYEQMPLVSLEEAVKPLLSILPEVQNYAYVAKQRCKIPADGLTPDESASIMIYTMEWEPSSGCLYVALNGTLRSEDRRRLNPWFLYLKLILTALAKLPSTRQTLYRRVQLDLGDRYPTDRTFVWWGFSSCTVSIDVLESELFLSKTGTRTIFTIECDTGKDISRHTMIPSKKEILLLPGFNFTVVGSLNAGNDVRVIHLKRTQPPCGTLLMLHPSFGRLPVLTVPPPPRRTLDDQNKSDAIEQQTKEAISNASKTTVKETAQ